MKHNGKCEIQRELARVITEFRKILGRHIDESVEHVSHLDHGCTK